MTALIYVLTYGLWSFFDYLTVTLAVDKFFVMDFKENKSYKKIWLLYDAIVTLGYCVVRYFNMSGWIISVFMLLFYTRLVPYLWSRFGVSLKISIVYIFYEDIITAIGTNVVIVLIMIRGYGNLNQEFLRISNINEVTFTVLAYVCLRILAYFKKNKIITIWFANLSNFEYIFFIMITFIVGNMETLICYKETDSLEDFVLKVLSILATTLLFILIGRMMIIIEKKSAMDKILSIMQEHMRQLTEYYTELTQKEEEFRKLRHDIKNLMLGLHSMIEEGENKQALKYIENMTYMYQNTVKKFDTGNFIADALLSSKSRVAKEKNTKILCQGFIPAEKIRDIDMVILLSNILDNAIEACAKLDGESTIMIKSVINKRTWALKVINPCIEDVEIYDNRIETSKSDKEGHGYGLINIERVVELYGGVLKIECEKNEFIMRITINME